MDPLLGVVLGAVALVAALFAYGSWLIGQGSSAELEARELSADSSVLSAGWTSLDWVRTAPLPVVQAVEDYLAHLRDVAYNLAGRQREADEE